MPNQPWTKWRGLGDATADVCSLTYLGPYLLVLRRSLKAFRPDVSIPPSQNLWSALLAWFRQHRNPAFKPHS